MLASEDKIEKEAEARDVEQDRKAQVLKWVKEKGTDSQQRRYVIGLLPESEVMDAIMDEELQGDRLRRLNLIGADCGGDMLIKTINNQ